MPGTAMMELDYYDALQLPDSLSLQEMIERDMRTGAESVLWNHSHVKDADVDTVNSSVTDDRLGAMDSELLRDVQNVTWYTTCHTSPSCNLDSDPAGILVKPQTGLPITYQLDTSIDLGLLSDERDSDDGEEQVPKSFNSVNPTMLEHHDANLLKEKLAKISGGIKHKVLGGRDGAINGVNNFSVKAPLRRDFLDDTTSSSSSSSSSSETSSSEEENDVLNNGECDEDDEDEDFDEEYYFNPKAAHANKSMKRKCPTGQPKNDERALSSQHANVEQALAGRVFPKPAYSYSCLIAMALKNSTTGSLPVSEIYGFMTENYPYFRTAPNGWKNSVRHNLSLNKCFEKIEKPGTGNQRKGCLWTMNPGKIGKMDEEVAKWQKKDPLAIKKSMAKPEHFELLEKGYLKLQASAREETNVATEYCEDQAVKPFTKIKTEPMPDSNDSHHFKPFTKIKTEPLQDSNDSHHFKPFTKIKTEEPMQDSNDSHLENSLLDLNYQCGLWGDLDEKMDFDIPLATDSFPNVQVGFSYEENAATGANGDASEVASVFNGTFLSKQLRVVKSTVLN